MTTINPQVRAVLQTALDNGGADGHLFRLSAAGQLDRKLYQAVNQILTNLGGKWVGRKVLAHVWPEGTDVAAKLASALDSGRATDPRKEEGFYATPDALADELVRRALHGRMGSPLVLEPSAGDGALVAAILRARPGAAISAVEPNRYRYAAGQARTYSRADWFNLTLEAYCNSLRPVFDAVVMNPPFTLPGQPTVWIDHVRLAYNLLISGGRLVSVVPNGFMFRNDRRHNALRELVAETGGWAELPGGSFTESGTGVNTCVIWMDKP